jgi:hypothetical protein
MKSKEQLDSFVDYCEQHGELRFFQALLQWTNENVRRADFIATVDWGVNEEGKQEMINLKDTFYD